MSKPIPPTPSRPAMSIGARVDSLKIDSDEYGFHLIIVDTTGDTYDFNFHGVAFEFAESKGLHDLLDWHGEGAAIREEARSSRPSQRSYSCEMDAHHMCVSQSAACDCDCHTLPITDPKNPRYRDTMIGDA